MFVDDFRPVIPAQLIGNSQKQATNFLYESIESGQPIQKLLFTGNSGVGKTTVARMYANLLVCESPEILHGHKVPCGQCQGCRFSYINIREMNCSSETGIDNIRDLLSTMSNFGFGNGRKVYILDEAHGLSKQAQNALLTPVEDLPPHVVICLITTEPDKIINTLRSRMMEFKFDIPDAQEQGMLAYSIGRKYEKALTDDELSEIVSMSNGNMRVLVHLTEQLLSGVALFDIKKESPEVENLIKALFYTRPMDIGYVFSEASKTGNYSGLADKMVYYSMNLLKSGKGNVLNKQMAVSVLKHLGDGLSKNTREQFSFMNKLAWIVSENQ